MEKMGDAEEEVESEETMAGSWPDVCKAILRMFLINEVLRNPYDSVTRAVHKEDEDEDSFDDRISMAARLCRHVFSKAEVVKNFIQGLKLSVREAFAQAVRLMSDNINNRLAVVSKAAVYQGKAQRLLLEKV